MSRSKKLVFFGNERLATAVETSAPTLRALVEAGYELSVVVSNYNDASSRNKRNLEIGSIAHAYHIPLLLPDKPSEIINELKSYRAETAVLVAYGKIIPQSVIDIFPKGIINIHPSLLPQYRGPTPLESAILDGVDETGISIMKLTKDMDAGPVFKQVRMRLEGNETKQQLADKLSSLGAKTIAEVLPAILEGSTKPRPQDEKKATYSKKLSKEDGILDWSKSAQQLEREVRAYASWPRSVTRIFGHKIIVTKVHIANPPAGGEKSNRLIMRAQPGWLEIDELIAPSGRTMSGVDFIRGY